MKKLFFAFMLLSAISVGVTAQNYDDNNHNYGSHNLNKRQSEQIREINIKYGKKFEAVGKDRSIRGSEKGEIKRALVIEKIKEIRAVIDSSNSDWKDSDYNYSDSKLDYSDKDRAIRQIEAEIDRAEGEYKIKKADAKASAKSKEEYKRRKSALKDEYKIRKEKLKDEKRAVKDSYNY